MNLSKIDLPEALATLLARGEPLSAAQLTAATGKSQPSISLALGKLGERVHRMGAARSTRYALKKDILGLAAEFPLYWRSSNAGFAVAYGTYLAGDYLHVKCQSRDGKIKEWLSHHELPWFLSTLKPQGYLGRQIARYLPQLPNNPEQWSLEQQLYSLQKINDHIGAIYTSDISVRTAYLRVDLPERRETVFDEYAKNDSAQLPIGSSAAGEQPKFIAAVGGHYYIVKFSPPHGTPFGERWGALLRLEKLALDTLQSKSVLCGQTELVKSPERTYLQSKRFDYDAHGTRQHIVAIAAVHDEFIRDSRGNWVETARALHAQNLITTQELKNIACIHAFGHYIGNTDMHFGNLSFFVDDVIIPKIRLAPVYDMLPMMWRPDSHRGLNDSPVRKQHMPDGFAKEQTQARQWAIEFWEQAAQLDIGADLQAASRESVRRLKTNFADV